MVTFSELGKLGRMGNQLFQIAATIGFAVKHERYYEIPAWNYNQYFNGLFNINPNLVIPELSWRWNEPHFHYKEIPPADPKLVNLYGYFQSEKYFEHCKEQIREIFSFRPAFVNAVHRFIAESATGKIPVSVHVRRTDYVGEMAHYYHNLGMDYYIQAMAQFDHSTHHFFVCSDDINWCKENFPKDFPITFSVLNEISDICLMSECKHNIIANSSFSWWGSYLNNNADKIVIAPSKDKWFQAVAGHNVDDLYLSNWKLI